MAPPLERWQRGPRVAVVMAGGRSSRFASIGMHKSMAAVRGMPVIGHVIDYWRAFADEFVFVVKNGKEPLMEYVRGLPIWARFTEPEALRGIADGLLSAESLVDSPFVMALGDCYLRGEFEFPPDFAQGHGIGVQRGAIASEIRRNYAVTVEAGRVTGVEEKPARVENDLCGMGFYFFQPDIFGHIRATPRSKRTGEHEITDVLQTLIERGPGLAAIPFDGTYVNINSPEDLDGLAAGIESGGGQAQRKA